MPSLGHQHLAGRDLTIKRLFRCRACDYEAFVVVTGIGMGSGVSPLFLDEEGAAERARASAYADATKNVELTLGLCPCPRCGQRRDARRFIRSSALQIVAMVALVWAAAGAALGFEALTHGLTRSEFMLYASISGGVGLTMGIIFFIVAVRWKWTTARARVVFKSDA
jgi:hypothetical protein